jgi:inorganic triphosphatase YgiF
MAGGSAMNPRVGARRSEVEATLLIDGAAPQETAARLARVPRLAGHDLAAGHRLLLDDLYYDGPDRGLRRNGFGLRTRRTGDARLLTLKGPRQPRDDDTVASRLEIEAPWSPDVLRAVLGMLGEHGVDLPAAVWRDDPDATLRDLGLVPMQARRTDRLARDVSADAGGTDRGIVAEMAIDRVTYRFADAAVDHYEVEIEAKTDAGTAQLAAMAEALLAHFPGALRPWRPSKLATGLAIEALLADGRLRTHIRDGALSPEAYPLISRWVQDNRRRNKRP